MNQRRWLKMFNSVIRTIVTKIRSPCCDPKIVISRAILNFIYRCECKTYKYMRTHSQFRATDSWIFQSRHLSPDRKMN